MNLNEATIEARLVRESPIAGSWYPGRRDELARTIEGFLAAVPPQPLLGELVALVAPHAGYMYSGQVAAHAYSLLQGKRYDVVAVVSPSHRPYSGRVLATAKRYYRTPLGLLEVNHHLLEELGKAVPLNYLERDEEHSLEIQLPFLQYLLGNFSLVPVMLQDQSYAIASSVGHALAKLLGDKKALLVASTDLSHFYNYDRATAMDQRALDSIARFDPEAFDRDIQSGRAEACGHGAVVAVLVAAKALGADKVTVLHYANSGDVTGDRYRVVGYGAAAITRSKTGETHQ